MNIATNEFTLWIRYSSACNSYANWVHIHALDILVLNNDNKYCPCICRHYAPAAATMEAGASRDATVAAPELPTIAAAAIGTETLSTLVTAVKAAGLVDTLSGEGTFTVFAPNNAAFDKIDADALAGLLKPENVDQLKAVLLRHVLPTVIKASDIPAGSTVVKTVGGEEITVTNADGTVTIESSAGKATVIATDVLASNGIVHVVDTVF